MGGFNMSKKLMSALALTASLLAAGSTFAQQPAATPAPAPGAAPAAAPAAPPPPPAYGAPISLDNAMKVVAAAQAEAQKNNWGMCIAVVGPSGDLIYFRKLDTCQYASIAIAQHKARTAATFRRPTKVFQDGLAANPANIYLLTLDGIIASEGGIPLIVDGKLIGAVGSSGGTGQQDGLTSTAGVAALK
jgi:uncharacterized protein GlcG (DUF336 family)